MATELQQAQQSLEDIATSAGQTAVIAPDLSRQVTRTAAAGSGLAAAVQEAEQAPLDEAQAALVAQQTQQTQETRQQAARAQQALQQGKSELERKTAREFENLSEQQANQVFEYRQKAQNILQSLVENRQNLSAQKQKAAAEQAGFLMRQSSKSYIDTLQLEGKRARLDSATGFRQAMLQSTFQEMQDFLDSDITFRRALAADKREFNDALAQMDLDTALSVAAGEAQTMATASTLSAISKIDSEAIKTGAQYLSKPAPTTQPTDTSLGTSGASAVPPPTNTMVS